MTGRPYVVLSCAMSLDGCLDGTGEDRLVLSGEADLDRVDAERAAADAILVGAGTIRRDDPRLLVRSARRQAERSARGRPPQPAGVTITASGDLDPAATPATGGIACSVKIGIMNDNKFIVPGVKIVQLDHVSPGGHSQFERRQRVLRGDLAVAAMADHQRSRAGDQLYGWEGGGFGGFHGKSRPKQAERQ